MSFRRIKFCNSAFISLVSVLFLQLPLVLWGIAVLVIYSLSQAIIDGMKAFVAALNMLMHVIYRFSNMRLITLLMVTAVRDCN
jgi:hypothetical protein